MIADVLAQIQKLERRLDDVSNRVQTILDDGFGPEPVDTLESNLDLLEKKIYDTRFELSRLTGKLGDMHESNIVLGRERNEALMERDKAKKLAEERKGYWETGDTPETDAMALSDVCTDHNWRTLCRKLERERNEAITQKDNYWKAIIMIDEIIKWAVTKTNSVGYLRFQLNELKEGIK